MNEVIEYAHKIFGDRPDLLNYYPSVAARSAFHTWLLEPRARPETFEATIEAFRDTAKGYNTASGVIAALLHGVELPIGLDRMRQILDEGIEENTIISDGQNIARRANTISLFSTNENTPSDERSISFSFSSEAPCEMLPGFFEVLGHGVGEADFSRLNDDAPFLYQHDARDQRGVIESAWIDSNRGYAQVRMSQNPKGQELLVDMRDGIRKKISLGYIPEKSVLVEIDEKEGRCLYRAVLWTGIEISSVAVPADNSVGLDRSAKIEIVSGPDSDFKCPKREIPMTITPQDQFSEMAQILALGRQYQNVELAASCVERKLNMQQTQQEFLAWFDQRENGEVKQSAPILGLSPSDREQFSVVRACAALSASDRSLAPYENEVSAAISSHVGKATSGFYVPIREMSLRTVQSVGSVGLGGATVQTTVYGDMLVEFLYNSSLIYQLGAMVLSDLTGNVDIPVQLTGQPHYWVSENQNIPRDAVEFGSVALRPYRVGGIGGISSTMLKQSSIDIEQNTRVNLLRSISSGVDAAAINGSGLNGVPKGILQTAGVGNVAIGTNGGAPTWSTIVELETLVALANADFGRLGYLTNPKVRGTLKTSLKNPLAADSRYIWESLMMASALADRRNIPYNLGVVNDYLAGVSNNAPRTLSKGSGTNLSALIFGDFSRLCVGTWGILEILPNPYGDLYASGGLEIRALLTCDTVVTRPASFAVCTDVLA